MGYEHVSLPGLNVIRSNEGRSLRAYKDSVGVWTIGYGITNYDKGIGFTVAAGVTITADQAEMLLVTSLQNNYEPAVRKVATGVLTSKQNWLDAGLDFHFNCGGITKATWPGALLRGDMNAAENSMDSWNKAGGAVLSGLTRRRKRDWAMIAANDYGPEGKSGPAIIEPNAQGTERQTGQNAGPLTSLPGTVSAGGLTSSLPPMPEGTVIAPTPHPDHVPGLLQVGAKDPDVIEFKKDLHALGYFKGSMDDVFDADFGLAVTDFQSHHPQLTADGKIGPATRAQIDREYALRSSASSTAKKGGAAVVLGGGVAKAAGLSFGTVFAVAGCVVVLVGVYFAIKYQDEIWRNINKAIGRVVP